MNSTSRICLSIGSLLSLIAFTPGALSAQLKTSEDKAPLFLFVFNASKASTHALAEYGGQLQLQIPKEEIRSVQMYSNRSEEVFTEFRQPGVRNLWKQGKVDFKNPAKATLSAVQSSTQIIEIFGIVVDSSSIQYRISAVGRELTGSRTLNNLTLTMDAAATWTSCSGELPCLGYGSPLLNASVCYGDNVIRDYCPDCGCCAAADE